MRHAALLPVAFMAAVLAAPAAALDVSLGAGVGVAPDYEGSDDYTIRPLWSLRVGNLYGPTTYVQLEGLILRSNLLPHPSLRLGPAMQVVPGRSHSTVEDNDVQQMQNISTAFMVGAIAGYDHALAPDRALFVEAFGRQAVGSDNGFLGTLSGGFRGLVAPQLRLRAALSSTWASEDYMSEYFGIDAANAQRSGLRQFDADAGIKDVSLGTALTYEFTPSWNATFLASYSRLFSDAEDSPITDDAGSANQFFFGATAGYRF